MNTIKTFFLLSAMAVTGLTQAALDPVSEVVEIAASNLRVPAHEAARMNVKPCSTCEIRTVRVTGDTVYRVDGFDAMAVTLRQFRSAAKAASKDELGVVYLTYLVDSGVVTEIVLQGSE